MKEIIKNNKDILYWGIIFSIFFICFVVYGRYLYVEYSDIGRELYIPTEILNGKVLYKDLFNIFAPMSYYLNAFIIKIAGNTFNTFFVIGAVISLFILIPLYKITKLYTNSEVALTTTILIILSCTFFYSMTNWITPYAYSVTYALAFIMWALWFLFKYTETSQGKYIYLSSLLYGISLSFKYDYILFIILILFCLIYKKAHIKSYFYCVILMLIFPFLSILLCLINGNTFDTLKNAFYLIIETAKSPSLSYYYKWAGVKPSLISFETLTWVPFPAVLFFWAGYFAILTLILYLIRRSPFKYIFLNICILLILFKYLWFINLYNYGVYSFPLLYINIVVFICSFAKKENQYIKSYKIILFLILTFNIILSCFYAAAKYIDSKEFKQIHTSKGSVYLNYHRHYQNFEKSVNYIQTHLKADDKILFIPEGVIYNYVTDRKSDGYLFYIVPNNLDVFGDDFYINHLKEQKFEYIVIQPWWYFQYGVGDFKSTYGNNIFEQYISKEYELADIINNSGADEDFYAEYEIYKRK